MFLPLGYLLAFHRSQFVSLLLPILRLLSLTVWTFGQIFRPYLGGFLLFLIAGSEMSLVMVYLSVFCVLFYLCPSILCVWFQLLLFVDLYRIHFQICFCFVFSRNLYGRLLLTSHFSFRGVFMMSWSYPPRPLLNE